MFEIGLKKSTATAKTQTTTDHRVQRLRRRRLQLALVKLPKCREGSLVTTRTMTWKWT